MSKQKRTRMNDEDAWSDNGLMQKRAPVDETMRFDEDTNALLEDLLTLDDFYPEQQTLSYVSQQDLTPKDLTDTPKDLTDKLCPVNAEAEPNIEFPQGNEGRIDNIWSNGDQLTKINSLPDGWSEIGKIAVSSTKIGEGSKGTIVYEGKYDGRPAAVKRLVRDCFDDVVSKEIDILIKADRHENIVWYYGVEKDRHFVYLALELCTCSLDDLIRVRLDSSNNSAYPRDPASTSDYKIKLDSVRGMMQDVNLWRADNYPSPQLMKLMRDMVLGLSHLHSHELGIIHRDLKPQNVLIAKNRELVARLSDMGISRCLTKDKSSLEYPTTGCGTSGWRAPEVLRSGGRQTRAIDSFSLGCVLFFCITRGKHPFGITWYVTLTFVRTKRTCLGWNSYQKLTI